MNKSNKFSRCHTLRNNASRRKIFTASFYTKSTSPSGVNVRNLFSSTRFLRIVQLHRHGSRVQSSRMILQYTRCRRATWYGAWYPWMRIKGLAPACEAICWINKANVKTRMTNTWCRHCYSLITIFLILIFLFFFFFLNFCIASSRWKILYNFYIRGQVLHITLCKCIVMW